MKGVLRTRVAAVPYRQLVLDWAAPLVVLAIGLVEIPMHAHSDSYPGSPVVHLAFLGVGVVLLGLRRRAPMAAPLAAIVVTTLWVAGMWPTDAQGPFEGFLVYVGASYSLGAGNPRQRLFRATAGLVVFDVAGLVIMAVGGGGVGDTLPVLVWVTLAWAIGVVIRSRGDQAHHARELAAQVEVSAERRTTEAVEQERSRIARELHDVVAHGLSVIVVQAAAERRALAHGTADTASTDATLESVERAGREALIDLRRLLGLLRKVDEPASLAPQPSLAQLDLLVASVRDAGIDVSVDIQREATELSAAVDLTAYRIVQESLTNVLKHSGATRVTISIRQSRGQLALDIVDDGPGVRGDSPAPGTGHGLLGMRERVTVFGGRVDTGPRPEGGWAVRARLPIGAPVLEPA